MCHMTYERLPVSVNVAVRESFSAAVQCVQQRWLGLLLQPITEPAFLLRTLCSLQQTDNVCFAVVCSFISKQSLLIFQVSLLPSWLHG